MPCRCRKGFQERNKLRRNHDADRCSRFGGVEINSVSSKLRNAQQARVTNSEASMTKSEDEGELSVARRLADDLLYFFFTERKSGIRFYLRGFDTLRWVRLKPAIFDAEVEKRADTFKLFGSGSRTDLPGFSKTPNRLRSNAAKIV